MYHHNPVLNLLIWIFTGFGLFSSKSKYERRGLDSLTQEILQATKANEKLRLEREQLQNQLNADKQEQEIELRRQRSVWEIEKNHERQNIQQEIKLQKEKFEAEKLQAVQKVKHESEIAAAQVKFETDTIVKKLQLEHDITLGTKKLEFEQKIKEVELKAEQKILAHKEEYAKKEADLHAKLHGDVYKKLQDALVEMTQKGDKNTQFVHELTLKIFDKVNPNTTENINRNYFGGAQAIPAPQEIEATVKNK